VSAELIGLADFNRSADRTAAEVEVRARAAADAAAHRIGLATRLRVRSAVRKRLRLAVVVREEPSASQFVVGFDDQALIAAGLPAMTPIWHEFGTKEMTANPALGDAVTAERQRYPNELRAAITGVLSEASR
jgi:hypothetical protein